MDDEIKKITEAIASHTLNSTTGQDVTMDNSYSLGGYRSPSSLNLHAGNGAVAGNTSPGQGRSLREYDEKLNALQKENFNLKLRLFFLEEKTPSTGPSKGDDDSLFKQNVDLKVENEELRKELQEKQDLLCQAAKAMELMEDSQKKSTDTSSATISDLTEKIQYLEEEIRTMEKYTSQSGANNVIFGRPISSANKIENDLKSKISKLEKTIKESEIKINSLTEQLDAAKKEIKVQVELAKRSEQHADEMANKLRELKDQLNQTDRAESFQLEADDLCELKKQIHVQKQFIAEQQCNIQDIEEKLQAKTRAHDKGCNTIRLLLIKTREQDAEIETLKSKEHTNTTPAEINSLKADLIQAQNAAEQANRWRKECADVCAVLTIRLKELAGFLDSLLKHKDVLSVLAQDRHRAMRKAVDRSLDLSRTLNMSAPGRFSLTEHSLLHISSSFSEIFNDSCFDGLFNDEDKENKSICVNKTESSLVENLRAEVRNLKSELERINAETGNSEEDGANGGAEQKDRSTRNISQIVEQNSESEAWSEPDRKVSHERIGLDDSIKLNKHVRSPSSKYKGTTSGSDDNNDSRTTRKNSGRLQEKLSELETQITEKDEEILDLKNSLLAAEGRLSNEQIKCTNLEEELNSARCAYATLETSLNDLKTRHKQLQLDFDREEVEKDKIMSEREVTTEELEHARHEILRLNEEHAIQIDTMISQETVKLELLRQQLTDKYQTALDEQNRNHEQSLANNWVLRVTYEEKIHQLEEMEKRLGDSEALLDLMRDNESEIKAQLIEKEKVIRGLKRNVDEVTLQTSKAVLERTKFMNERDQFEQLNRSLQEKCDSLAVERSELHSKLAELAHNNAQLHNKLVVNDTQFQLTRSASQGNARYALTASPKVCGNSSGGEQSGYTSDELKQRLENSSPDLGIDSDGTGRSSGTDAIPKLERSSKLDFKYSFANTLLEGEEDEESSPSAVQRTTPTKSAISIVIQHDCEKVEKDNAELRRKLERTRRAFEKTWAQLRISNQRKEQIEKDIRQEIYKTHSVLKNVRSNMESVGQQQQQSSRSPNSVKQEH